MRPSKKSGGDLTKNSGRAWKHFFPLWRWRPLWSQRHGARRLVERHGERTRTLQPKKQLPSVPSNDNKRTCRGAGNSLTSGDLHWDFNQGVSSDLIEELASKFSKSVVSLALSDGNTVLFASSGIVIECQMHVTRFLTSASLVRALNNEAKYHDNAKIEVRHEEHIVVGLLEEYDLDFEFAVVKSTSLLGVHAVCLNNLWDFMPYCVVVSLGRDTSGKVMAIGGKLTCDSSGSDDRECLMFSSCKLSEVCEGGPVFDFDGEFVGMNLLPSMEKSFFLPKLLIVERLQHFHTSKQRVAFLARIKDLKMSRVGERLADDISHSRPQVQRDARDKDLHGVLEALGYPSQPNSDMILVNTFEEPFGDVLPMRYSGEKLEQPSTERYAYLKLTGVWKQFSKRGRKMFRNVVSLASFKGGTRFFACSGFFIDWNDKCGGNECQTILTSASLVRNPEYPFDDGNKIVAGLRIEVLLPDLKRREGTLIHFNLHYNVALVSVKKHHSVSPAILKHERVEQSSELLVAVGRCFKSGDLMASGGKLVSWSGPFDCKNLLHSTCKISKAGIGGPLVDLDGHYIGMNFYDPKVGTPFLFCDDIVDILDCFKKGTVAEADNFRIAGDDSVCLNMWPVPPPYWRHPDDPQDNMSEYDREVLASGCQYKYHDGHIYICM